MKPTFKFGTSLSLVNKLSVLWRILKDLGLIIALNGITKLDKYIL